MMKWLLSLTLCLSISSYAEESVPFTFDLEKEIQTLEQENMLVAQNKRRRSRRAQRRRQSRNELVKALRLAERKDYVNASIQLFRLSQSPTYRDSRSRIKHILGLMLLRMKLNQTAAFQFISVIKSDDKKFLRQALEKLSIAADYLGDDALLNYALSRVEVKDFPSVHRDMLYFRIGEFQLKSGQARQAIQSLERVNDDSPYFARAKYLQGLAYAELGKATRSSKLALKAAETFEELERSRVDKSVTDESRIAGIMGKARSLYQAGEWEKSLAEYRRVPKDTELWHATLFESSWAMLRSGRFRSALSNFHSLHSAYYEDNYLPESLILRSIIYLYICKYDEMDKMLALYDKIYGPVRGKLKEFTTRYQRPSLYFSEVRRAVAADTAEEKARLRAPYIALRYVYQQPDFQNTYKYAYRLYKERARIRRLPEAWQRSAIGRYANKILKTRLQKAQAKGGAIARNHLIAMQSELLEFSEQKELVKFEMLKGQRDTIKQRISGRTFEDLSVEENRNRDYYVQNGYEYWPFKGEYWLDELGNYHYLGVQACPQ